MCVGTKLTRQPAKVQAHNSVCGSNAITTVTVRNVAVPQPSNPRATAVAVRLTHVVPTIYTSPGNVPAVQSR